MHQAVVVTPADHLGAHRHLLGVDRVVDRHSLGADHRGRDHRRDLVVAGGAGRLALELRLLPVEDGHRLGDGLAQRLLVGGAGGDGEGGDEYCGDGEGKYQTHHLAPLATSIGARSGWYRRAYIRGVRPWASGTLGLAPAASSKRSFSAGSRLVMAAAIRAVASWVPRPSSVAPRSSRRLTMAASPELAAKTRASFSVLPLAPW